MDAKRGSLTIEQGRFALLREFIFDAVAFIWPNHGLEALTLASVVGKLQPVVATTIGGGQKLRHLNNALIASGIMIHWQRGRKVTTWVPLGKPEKEEAGWWVNQLGEPTPPTTVAWAFKHPGTFLFTHRSFLKTWKNDFPLWPESHKISLRVDARTEIGCGGSFHWVGAKGRKKSAHFAWKRGEFKTKFAAWFPTAKLSLWHIKTKEFATVVGIIIVAFSQWKQRGFAHSPLTGRLIVTDTDNIAAMHYTNVMQGNSELMAALAGCLQKHLAFLRCAIWARRRAGENNVIAGALSRDPLVPRDHAWEWLIPPRQMGAILATLGISKFDWDLMAASNSQWRVNCIGGHQGLFAIDVRNWVGSTGTAWVFPPATVMRQLE